MASAMS
ncbi:hypothetical protein D018_1139A, partial [Vibrio parahaemolyticus VP2007-007]